MDSAGNAYRNGGRNANPVTTVPSVTTKTAYQFYQDRDCVVYLYMSSSSGDTPSILIGPDDGTGITLGLLSIAAGGDALATVKLPAGWWVFVNTGGDTMVASCTVVAD